jgi:hypothetical protein
VFAASIQENHCKSKAILQKKIVSPSFLIEDEE